MRPIKFRAWNGRKIISWDVLKNLKTIMLSLILEGLHRDYIPMQFTGLRDKNGQEMYEGDIIAKYEGGYFWDNDGEKPKGLYSVNTIKVINVDEDGNKWCCYDKIRGVIEWSDRTGYEPFCDSRENCGHCGGGRRP